MVFWVIFIMHVVGVYAGVRLGNLAAHDNYNEAFVFYICAAIGLIAAVGLVTGAYIFEWEYVRPVFDCVENCR